MDVAFIKPVTLPPGLLKLATRPDLIGSLLVIMRVGIVEVAALAANAPTSKNQPHRKLNQLSGQCR
jgi:hypothetical protein